MLIQQTIICQNEGLIMKGFPLNKTFTYAATVIFLCFLLTSVGYLSWTYHLAELFPSGTMEIISMVVGYILQAIGLGVFYYIMTKYPGSGKSALYIALLVHMVTLVPAVLTDHAAATIIFGSLMNVACGIIAGYYLYVMTAVVPAERKASVFGMGYGIAILASWLISLIDGGTLYHSEYILIVCAGLTVLSFGCIHRIHLKTDDITPNVNICEIKTNEQNYTLLAMVLIFLFGLLNSCSFSFPSADILGGLNVEFSRLLYAAGLIIAGFVTDKSRRYSAVLSLAVLAIPFILLALQNEMVSATLFWALGYFAFGFYSVFRVILFSDIASEKGMLQLSVFGLLIGRIGEAAGEGITLALKEQLTILVILAALLFVVTVIVFFMVYRGRYMKVSKRMTERERFALFAAKHDLSSREREVLGLIITEKTNAEIAEELCISENTVKFHVRNLLQKTGCKNRKELHSYYFHPENM